MNWNRRLSIWKSVFYIISILINRTSVKKSFLNYTQSSFCIHFRRYCLKMLQYRLKKPYYQKMSFLFYLLQHQLRLWQL